jgi:hypothetical protein
MRLSLFVICFFVFDKMGSDRGEIGLHCFQSGSVMQMRG